MMKTLLFLLACLVAADAAAQTGFVQGGYIRDIKRFSHEGQASVFDGTVDGFSIGAAGFIAPHWSAGIELDYGGATTATEIVTVSISGRPAEIRTDYTSKRRSVEALAGLHTRADRPVRVGCYAGLSFTAFRREIASNAPAIVLQEPSPLSVLNERVTGAIVGVDVAIRLGAHVAVVPGFRAQGLSLSGDLTGFSLRPGISGRISF
jgi:hypothetical protein